MATLTATATLTGSGLTSSTLSITKNPAVTVLGDVQIRRITLGTTTTKVLDAADWNESGAMLWLFNTEATGGKDIFIGLDTDGTPQAGLDSTHMVIKPGEWAFFPWAAEVSLWADVSADTCQLEYGIFERAAS